jgi:hypothetical protein
MWSCWVASFGLRQFTDPAILRSRQPRRRGFGQESGGDVADHIEWHATDRCRGGPGIVEQDEQLWEREAARPARRPTRDPTMPAPHENAEQTPDDCLPQYAFTKRACQAAAPRDTAEPADQLDAELPTEMTSDDARHAHHRYWAQLKGQQPPW